MRGFAGTLFNALLGWIRTIVETVWNILFSSDTQRWLQWIGENWILLVALLCVAGVVIDYLVWLIRWRPYYVWGSRIRRFRRLFGHRDDELHETSYAQQAYQPQPRPALPTRQRNAPLAQPEWNETASWNRGNVLEQNQEWDQTQKWESLPPELNAASPYERPTQTSYEPQYARRFAKPENNEPAYSGEYQAQTWEDARQSGYAVQQLEEDSAYVADSAEQEYQENYDDTPDLSGRLIEDVYTTPAKQKVSDEEPVHPGIDYQALSRKYGWHNPVPPSEYSEPVEDAYLPEDDQVDGQEWGTAGLHDFAPYTPPPVPTITTAPEPAQRKKREGRWRESNPLAKVKNGLSRVAQKAGKVLTVDDEEEAKLLDGLPPPIDKNRAFHAPVYPKSWNGNPPRGKQGDGNPDFQEDD